MFGITYPVMAAPMSLHSGGTLAAAVSAAGGLGSFGGTHPWKGPDWIHAEIATIRATTHLPFGVGFITPFLPFTEPHFEAALEERPEVIALSFADPQPWLARAKAAGARVMCQVQNYDDAQTAVAAGADVLVVQGSEAGGHTGTMGLLPFLAGVVRRYPDVPGWPQEALAMAEHSRPSSPPGRTAPGWERRFSPRPKRSRYTMPTSA